MNIEKATATTGGDLIERIQQAAIDRGERGKPEGRNHVQQFFYEAAQQPEPKVICSYCKVVVREGDESQISHGACDPCTTRVLAEIEARAANR